MNKDVYALTARQILRDYLEHFLNYRGESNAKGNFLTGKTLLMYILLRQHFHS
jgi:hypothetical protein